jgi:hypothetical protein
MKMSLDTLAEMVENYRAGDLQMVEDLNEELELDEDSYHQTSGRFTYDPNNAASFSQGNGKPRYKMSGGKKKGRVKLCGREARTSGKNILCQTGKPPAYAANRKARATGAGPRAAKAAGGGADMSSSPASSRRGGAKGPARGKSLARANGALRARGVDMSQIGDAKLRKTARQLATIQRKAQSDGARSRADVALALVQQELDKRGKGGPMGKSFTDKARQKAADTIVTRRRAVAESEDEDAADMLAGMFDEGDDYED